MSTHAAGFHHHFHHAWAECAHRTRDRNGRIRAKNGETRLARLEATYGPLCSLPGATPLWLLRVAAGNHSLSFILRHPALLDAGW